MEGLVGGEGVADDFEAEFLSFEVGISFLFWGECCVHGTGSFWGVATTPSYFNM